jgi:nucleoside-diphosphate-sugar epimerase
MPDVKPDLFTVFGANGFIGAHVVGRLRQAGHRVREAGRGQFPPSRAQLGHVIYAIGLTADFRKKPYETVDAHVSVFRDVITRYRWSSILYLSSTRIYGLSKQTHEDSSIVAHPTEPDAFYDITKLAGEAVCLSERNPCARVARLSNVVGPGDSATNFLPSLVHDARRHRRILFQTAPGSQKDYIDVADVVRLLEQIALRGDQRVYNVATGRNTSNAVIARLLRRHFSADVAFVPKAPAIRRSPIETERVEREFEFRAIPFDQSFLSAFGRTKRREEVS